MCSSDSAQGLCIDCSPAHEGRAGIITILLEHLLLVMSKRPLDDLLQHRQELDGALATTKRELKKAKQGDKDAMRGKVSAWRLSKSLVHIVLIIYNLTDYTVEPAVKYLRTSGQKRHWPEKSDEELEEMLMDYFLDADPHEVAGLSDITNPSDAVALRVALDYVEQWRLVMWIQDINDQKGVAPSTDAVLQQLEVSRSGLPADVRPVARGNSADGKNRMWAKRLRKRWGGRHAKLRVREDIPLQEMRDKARLQTNIFGVNIGVKTGPPGGPHFRDRLFEL